ncbi:MAG: type III-B CRISPR-associated protein Cas10/Cmr2, partial [Victivallales bacterium]|nr:type III-B CRISPR-associated protein Cas10/Cmr2 [Victivallales bacterium]
TQNAPLPSQRVFKHPLSSETCELNGMSKNGNDLANELQEKFSSKELSEQKLLHLMWRCGAEFLPDNALTPADPNLPDFTVWNHLAARAALANCIDDQNQVRPAFLMFQLGPVQEFIAQARSTRDLWSGSYMLSWLMANALKAVTDKLGPAAIIFPNLRGNGIFDALHQKLYTKAKVWEELVKGHDEAQWKLTPTLPNRFLALVPADMAKELAEKAEQAIRNELVKMADPVWNWVKEQAKASKAVASDDDLKQWKKRWDAQIQDFPKITWAVQPWDGLDSLTLEPYRSLPINHPACQKGETRKSPADNLATLLKLAQGKPNPGMLWSAYYGLVDAKLAARRNTREFDAWQTVNVDNALKDSLSGKEEIIGNEKFWNHIRDQFEKIFTASGHCYGAMNLVKRLWCRQEMLEKDNENTLWNRIGISENFFGKAIGMDSTQEVAAQNKNGGGYIAVIAMDGDEMGKWISGERTPELEKQLVVPPKSGVAGIHRPLTPAYHLQFSEALSNFSIWKAAKVVKSFEGQLIYAGGDDVLAMLPASQAIDCAKALQEAFRLDFDDKRLMPGSKGNVSAGIAIGHCEAPLQMLVKEAQKAEHRAKHDYGRQALAISLYKRSGEIIQWGCKWNSTALPLLEFLEKHRAPIADETKPEENPHGKLSGRFPYALARLLAPYRLGKDNTLGAAELQEIILRETQIVIRQQASELSEDEKTTLRALCEKWCEECSKDDEDEKAPAKPQPENADTGETAKPKHKLADFIQPYMTEAFINRKRGDN